MKTVIHHCLTCYHYKVQASQQLMIELPFLRVRPARPFLTTGVDYAGPISIRLGPPRGKQVSKGYIAIFICFVVKAVHIELVTSLTTDAFLAALDDSSPDEENQGPFTLTMALVFKEQHINCTKCTPCFTLLPRWQLSRTT